MVVGVAAWVGIISSLACPLNKMQHVCPHPVTYLAIQVLRWLPLVIVVGTYLAVFMVLAAANGWHIIAPAPMTAVGIIGVISVCKDAVKLEWPWG